MMKTCARAHDRITYEAGDCPLCEAMELTLQLIDLSVRHQESVCDDLSLIKSTLMTMVAAETEYNESVLALFKTAGKATK